MARRIAGSEDGSEGSFNEKGGDSSEEETTFVKEREDADIAEELHSKQQQQQELHGENETSHVKDEDYHEAGAASGGENQSGERTKNATRHSPSGAIPKQSNPLRTTNDTCSRKPTSNHAEDTKPGTSKPGAWRQRTSGRVLPVLCDDGQEIDVLDSGDLFAMGERRGNVENDKSGCDRSGNRKLSHEKERSPCIDIFAASSSADDTNPDAAAASSSPSSRLENSSMWPSPSDEKPQKEDHKKKSTSLRKSLFWCFGAKQNKNKHNVNVQTIGDFDIFLSSASESRKACTNVKTKEETEVDFEQRGCCYDCLFLCKTSEELNDELLRKTYQCRGEIKKYEEKLQKLEEEQNSYLESAQKRYEDLVWGKEDFIYDIKEIDFQMKVLEREFHNPQESTNVNNDQETSARSPTGNPSVTTFSSRRRQKSISRPKTPNPP